MLARWFRVPHENRRLMLMCGIAAGFGAVFGTPLTGAIFAMEVLVIGRVQYEALIPVLLASIVGDATCSAWGIHHTVYHLDVAHSAVTHASFNAVLLGKVALAGIAFGLGGRLFSELTHRLQRGFARLVPYAPLRPALSAVIVIAFAFALGTRDYLGLGVNAPLGGYVSIVASFQEGGATPLSWLWKTLFTSITLAGGFKGGEVTPLFFGASLD
jgi:H+/Cl- antiporter ClcA